MYKLFCVLQSELGSPFPVNIAATDTFGDLKDAIKAKQPETLGMINADRLTLYRIDVDVSGVTTEEQIREKLEGQSQPKSMARLNPMSELGEIYLHEPPKKMIHVLVVPPAPGE
jgi:hypothetical protein